MILLKKLFKSILFGSTTKELGRIIWTCMSILLPIIAVFGSMFVIAAIVDSYGDVYLLLYIPFFWILLWASPKSENGL
jgi:hypothetical protein